MPPDASQQLWVVCAYFNPYREPGRLENFRIFRENCTVPLLVVEHSVGGHFELRDEDADLLVRVRGGDVLWQKERLLNVSLGHLPPECAYVAWLDADVVFENPAWPEEAVALLQTCPLVQLFGKVEQVTQLPALDGSPTGNVCSRSLVSMLQDKSVSLDVFGRCGGSILHGYSPGHAWAVRREVLASGGFYDAFILGSGDKAMAAAAYGCAEALTTALFLNDLQERHFLAWAKPFWREVRGNVGYLESTLYHLAHGRLSTRGYTTRYQGFSEYHFDPAKDVQVTREGSWGWSTTKPRMHRYVEAYFQSRKEEALTQSRTSLPDTEQP